jgi:hypothetical protein
MRIYPLALVLLLSVAVLSGCGEEKDDDSRPASSNPKTSAAPSPPRSGDVSQPAATPEKCGESTQLQGGVTIREECGDARVTMTQGKTSAKMLGVCKTGRTWFELVAGTSVVSSETAPSAGTAPGNRVIINIGPKTGNPAGSQLKRAPKDGTYSPVSMVATLDGTVYSAFADTTATLRGGRTEGTVVAIQPDGTKITVEFTCRKLQSK